MGVLYVLSALILAKWFSILRAPGEILSFYNRMLISWDYDYVELEFCDITGFKERSKFVLWVIRVNAKPFFYKVLTCPLCHSGYLAIYFIFAYDQHLMILPTTMVAYYLLSKVKFK